jgi:Ca-activated chloride channel family protein
MKIRTYDPRHYLACLFVMGCLLLPGLALGQGMMLPKEPDTEPLELKSHRVEALIKDGAGKTTVTQVFHNNCSSQIEATYIFPLPADAAISDFSLWINGKKKKGEVLEKGEAAQIYQDIVSRLKDPGLLEYMGGKLFKARVFPIPAQGDQKVEIAFTQSLDAFGSLYKYVYPLKTSGNPVTTKEDFTFTATIKASDPIKSIYSPSHDIEVQMNGAKEAVVGFEKNKVTLGRNFILYFNVTEDRVGLSLLAHKRAKKDGSFLLMLSPGQFTKSSDVIDKNVTFVIDTSGSMNGEKMAGAKKALAYCIKELRSQERFNVIRFASTSQALFEAPVAADKESKQEALEWIDDMGAAGGTAIESALKRALSQRGDASVLPHYIVFITDGMPTVGMTDPDKLVSLIAKLNGAKPTSKIFVFGLGDDVNANFLDLLAGRNHGTSRYAESGDKLETVVERFYSAVAMPAMTGVSLSLEKIEAADVFPQQMPDIFYGDQLTVAGRYGKGGMGKIVLIGHVGKKIKKITYTRVFPKEEDDNDFIEHIWATRKVGYLLDQIRLNGESSELRDEVIALAQRYGIVTPYTSYLVVEDDMGPLPEDPGFPPPLPPMPVPGPVYTPYPGGPGLGGYWIDEESAFDSTGTLAPAPAAAGGETKKYEAMKTVTESAGSLSSGKAKGKDGAVMSTVLDDMKNADKAASGPSKLISGRLFVFSGGRWIDQTFKKDMDILKIRFGSDAYFKLLELKPDLKKFLAIGTDVIIVVGDGKAISIESSCEGSPDEKKIKKFLP